MRVGTVKKAECQGIDAFELWCWRGLLRVPWTARRWNQSILKEISPEYSLEGLKLKLKLQYFGHLMWRTDSLEKTLVLGKTEAGGERDNRGWDDWIVSLIQWIWVWASSGSWWCTGEPGVLQSMGSQRVGHDWTEQLNWRRWCYNPISHMRLEAQRGWAPCPRSHSWWQQSWELTHCSWIWSLDAVMTWGSSKEWGRNRCPDLARHTCMHTYTHMWTWLSPLRLQESD